MRAQTSISGTVDDAIRFHWDVECGVLCLRLLSRAEAECTGDETDDGFVLLRAPDDDGVVGMTIVSYSCRWLHWESCAWDDWERGLESATRPMALDGPEDEPRPAPQALRAAEPYPRHRLRTEVRAPSGGSGACRYTRF